MYTQEAQMGCATFGKQVQVMKQIMDRVKETSEEEEKAVFAAVLEKEVDVLLFCRRYDEGSLDCKTCRFVGHLRRRTADLVAKAERFA